MEDVFKTTDRHNRFNDKGEEILNPTPMQPPLGYNRAPSLAEQIRLQVRQLKHLDDDEPESMEEADDFEIEDDPQPESRWENDMVPSIKEIANRGRLLERQFAELSAQAPPKAAPEPALDEPPAPAAKTGQSQQQPRTAPRGARSFWPTSE